MNSSKSWLFFKFNIYLLEWLVSRWIGLRLSRCEVKCLDRCKRFEKARIIRKQKAIRPRLEWRSIASHINTDSFLSKWDALFFDLDFDEIVWKLTRKWKIRACCLRWASARRETRRFVLNQCSGRSRNNDFCFVAPRSASRPTIYTVGSFF